MQQTISDIKVPEKCMLCNNIIKDRFILTGNPDNSMDKIIDNIERIVCKNCAIMRGGFID